MNTFIIASELAEIEKFNSLFTCITSCIITFLFLGVILLIARIFRTPLFYVAAGIFTISEIGEIAWRIIYSSTNANIEWLYNAYRYGILGSIVPMIALFIFFRRRFSLKAFISAFKQKPQSILLILSAISFTALICGVFMFEEGTLGFEVFNQITLLSAIALFFTSFAIATKNADLEELYSKKRSLIYKKEK